MRVGLLPGEWKGQRVRSGETILRRQEALAESSRAAPGPLTASPGSTFGAAGGEQGGVGAVEPVLGGDEPHQSRISLLLLLPGLKGMTSGWREGLDEGGGAVFNQLQIDGIWEG